jgi:hypothetical protein
VYTIFNEKFFKPVKVLIWAFFLMMISQKVLN